MKPIDFVLTPYEQSTAANATIYLEDRRRRLNERDARRAQYADTKEGGLQDVAGQKHPLPQGI